MSDDFKGMIPAMFANAEAHAEAKAEVESLDSTVFADSTAAGAAAAPAADVDVARLAAIEVSGVCKSFDGFEALKSVSMHVPAGAVYGLVGPNGAGKTTLLQHLAGIYRQDSGDVLVAGEPVFENPQVKQRIAYVPSTLYIPPRATIQSMAKLQKAMSGAANGVASGAANGAASGAASSAASGAASGVASGAAGGAFDAASVAAGFDQARFDSLAEHFGLDVKKPLRKFSKGMQKQAALWLALSNRPDILILDEPMDGLDPLMRRTVWGLIMDDVAQRGMTVVISSHNLRELEGACSHLGIMYQGCMLCEHDLLSLDGGMVKVQIALMDGPCAVRSNLAIPTLVDVVHESVEGRLRTLVVRGSAEEVRAKLQQLNPVLLEIMPLSLEELFRYELEGVDEHVKRELL